MRKQKDKQKQHTLNSDVSKNQKIMSQSLMEEPSLIVNKFVTDFQFDCKKILHLSLANLIPKQIQLGLTYDFINKKISGPKSQCLKKIQQCNEFLLNHKMKIIFDIQIQFNQKMYLHYKLDALIFGRQLVQQTCNRLIKKQNLGELKKEVANILERKYYFMISITQQYLDQLQNALEVIKKPITRIQLKQAEQERRQINQKKERQKQQKLQKQKKKKKKYVPLQSQKMSLPNKRLQPSDKINRNNSIEEDQKSKIKQKYDIKKIDQIHSLQINLQKFQNYLQDQRLKKLLKQTLTQILQKYSYIKVSQVCFSVDKFIVQFKTQEQVNKQFIAKHKSEIESEFTKNIQCEEIKDYNEINKELIQKYLIFKQKQNPSNAIIIQKKDKIIPLITLIMQEFNKEEMKNIEIKVRKDVIYLVKQYIQGLKGNNMEFLNKSKLTYLTEAKNCKIEVFGHKKVIMKTLELIQSFIKQLNKKIGEKTFQISQIQASLLEKHQNQFQKQLSNTFKSTFILNSKNIEALITLGSKNKDNIFIYIQKQQKLSSLPEYTTFTFFNQDELNFMNEDIFLDQKKALSRKKQFSVSNAKKMHKFIIYQNYMTIKQGIQFSIKNSISNQDKNSKKNFVYFMPKNSKPKFISEIIQSFASYCGTNQIHNIFIFVNQTQDFAKNLIILQKLNEKYSKNQKIKYYPNKMFSCYMDHVEDKIEQAQILGHHKLYIMNPYQYKPDQYTHLCSFKQQKLKHCITGKEYQLKIYPNKVVFNINQMQFEIPQQYVKKIQKTLKKQNWASVYLYLAEFDLQKGVEVQLFTQSKDQIVNSKTQIWDQYKQIKFNMISNFKTHHVSIYYPINQEKQAQKLFQKLKQLISKHQITIIHNLKDNEKIQNNKLKTLDSFAKDNNVQIQYCQKKFIKLSSYDKIGIEMVKKNIGYLLAENKQIKYPEYWQPQTQQIKTFVVPSNSKQFQTVQQAFKISPIKYLIRIQNKILYDKFQNEKQALIGLNQGKNIYTMMLYHGTSKTDPKFIYQDKQESFNINYTSQKNFLGQGTYFAQQAKYSNNYAFQQVEHGQIIKSMFYCQVLVGQTQKLKAQNEETRMMKDTAFKDINKKLRYQSATMFSGNSNIYAVYKNRRAYPNYLIKY